MVFSSENEFLKPRKIKVKGAVFKYHEVYYKHYTENSFSAFTGEKQRKRLKDHLVGLCQRDHSDNF